MVYNVEQTKQSNARTDAELFGQLADVLCHAKKAVVDHMEQKKQERQVKRPANREKKGR